MKSFDPFSEEGRAWLDYNSEEDEFGAYENLGRGRTRVHSIPKKKKKEKSYVKEKGSDKKGDYLVFGGKRKKRKSRRRKRKSRRRKRKSRRKKRKSRRRKRKKGGFCLTKKCKLKKMKKKEEKRYKNFIDETDKERWKLAWEMCDMKNKTDYDNCVNKIVGKSNIIEDIDINFIKKFLFMFLISFFTFTNYLIKRFVEHPFCGIYFIRSFKAIFYYFIRNI